MNDIPEVWLEVPETDGRYMISNKGHLKQVGKRQRRGKHEVMVFSNKIFPIIVDYVSGKPSGYVKNLNTLLRFLRFSPFCPKKTLSVVLQKTPI